MMTRAQISALPDDDLDTLVAEARAEQAARQVLARAEERAVQVEEQHAANLDAVAHDFHMAKARTEGRDPSQPQPWVQPTGRHDAWPKRSHVTHQGKTWESLISANVHEPGVSGWREVVPEPEPGEPQVYPEWVQPSGGHDAYNTGDRVTFEGQVHESTIDGNVWSPAAHPAGWRLLEGDD